MEEIGKLLPSVFKNYLQRNDPCVLQILAPLWAQVVGTKIAQHSNPVFFTGGTLKLAASCPTWAVQLRHISEEIRHEVNRYLGGNLVRKVVIAHRSGFEGPRSGPRTQAAGFEAGHPDDAPLDCSALLAPVAQTPQARTGDAQLSPELARILQRSFAKYFSRTAARKNGRKVN